MNATVRNITPLPSIADVYRTIRGEDLPGDGDDRRGFCLAVAHNDVNNPSCDYSMTKGAFHCKTCEANGGVLALIVAAAKATDNKGALAWLREVGLMQKGSAKVDAWERVDVRYPYVDAAGKTLYEVGRWNTPKQFGQRVPDGKGGWKTGKDVLRGVERVPYALPELLAACAASAVVYVVEGEKDANNLRERGVCATTSAQGATWPWPIEWAEYFKGASRVVVICDNDDAGRKGGHRRAGIIAHAVADTRIIEALPGVGKHGDVSDWLADGGTLEALAQLADTAPIVAPYNPPYPPQAVPPLLAYLSDTGNGKWFADTVGADARYVADLKAWFAYADGVWSARANTVALTERAVKMMRAACEDYTGPNADEFADHADKAESMNARRAMLEASQAHLTLYSTDFNGSGVLLNVANGTLNLETGELLPHTREHYLTFKSPVMYDPAATCPNFEKLLDEATADADGTPRPHLREYVELMLGGALVARPTQRRCYFLFGPKGTRKSTLIRVLETILDGFATSVSYKVLSETKFESDGQGPSPATAKLRNRRLVVASEAKENQRLDVAFIKRLIGGDTISARHLNAEEQHFRFEATLIMTGNEMPRIIGDDSFWEKFKPIPFENPITAEDPEFEEKVLKPELPGILALLVRAHQRLRAAGYKVEDPPEVRERCQEERDAQNPVADFVRDCTVTVPEGRIEKNQLREAYKRYCERVGLYALGNRSLANQLVKELKWTYKQENSAAYWLGVALKPEAEGRGTDAF